MNIVICDDEQVYCEEIKYFADLHYRQIKQFQEVTINLYSSAEDILNSNEKIDLLLLDIEIGEENGVVFREKMNQEGWEVPVIFISAYESYILETFGKNVYGFVKKPIVKEEILHAFERVDKECFAMKKYKMSDGTGIAEKDIIRIISGQGYSLLETVKGDYVSNDLISDWKKILPGEYFIQVHRSYIINLQYVTAFKRGNVMQEGRATKVSRLKEKEIKQRYEEYLLKKGEWW